MHSGLVRPAVAPYRPALQVKQAEPRGSVVSSGPYLPAGQAVQVVGFDRQEQPDPAYGLAIRTDCSIGGDLHILPRWDQNGRTSLIQHPVSFWGQQSTCRVGRERTCSG